jgi:hypothetical protein
MRPAHFHSHQWNLIVYLINLRCQNIHADIEGLLRVAHLIDAAIKTGLACARQKLLW